MTHDELLAKIDKPYFFTEMLTESKVEIDKKIAALRAVVEYIRPNDWDFTDEKYSKLAIFNIIEKELR